MDEQFNKDAVDIAALYGVSEEQLKETSKSVVTFTPTNFDAIQAAIAAVDKLPDYTPTAVCYEGEWYYRDNPDDMAKLLKLVEDPTSETFYIK